MTTDFGMVRAELALKLPSMAAARTFDWR